MEAIDSQQNLMLH